MRKVHKYDSDGFYTEDIIIGDLDIIPSDCTDVPVPDGLYKGKFVNGSWVEMETQENLLRIAKDKKKAELDSKCDSSIMGGFPSSALGTQHFYQSLVVDEIWLNATINRFLIDPNFTTVNYKTIDAGYLQHTKEQFNQVFIDGHSFGDAQITKLNSLKSQVDDNATDTVDKVNAISW